MPLPTTSTPSTPVSGTSVKADSVADAPTNPSPALSKPHTMPSSMSEGPGFVLPPTVNRPITRSSARKSAFAEKQVSASETLVPDHSSPLHTILPSSAAPSTPLSGQQSQLPATGPNNASTPVLSKYKGPTTLEQQKMIDHLMSMTQLDPARPFSTGTAAPASDQAPSTSWHTFLISSVSPSVWAAGHPRFCNRDPMLQASGLGQVRNMHTAANSSEVDREVDDGREGTSAPARISGRNGETDERDGGENGSGKRRVE